MLRPTTRTEWMPRPVSVVRADAPAADARASVVPFPAREER